MTAAGGVFYGAGALVLAATALAVTRREPVHAVLWFAASLLGMAGLYALLGAPMVAAFLVILYAGGLLVLFLFVVMMLRGTPSPVLAGAGSLSRRRAGGLAAVAAAGLGAVAWLLAADPDWGVVLTASSFEPRAFGHFVFSRYALCVELLSVALFVPLVGALLLGRSRECGKGSS